MSIGQMSDIILELREENRSLKEELESLKEGVLIESMNDMRDKYLELERELERVQSSMVSEMRYNMVRDKVRNYEILWKVLSIMIESIKCQLQTDINIPMNIRTEYKVRVTQLKEVMDVHYI